MVELLNNISPKLLRAIVSVAVIMPFWYVGIYLLHRKFYDTSSNLLKWVFCFCLSSIWLITFLIGTDVFCEKEIIEAVKDRTTEGLTFNDLLYPLSSLFSIFSLVIIIVTSYFGNKRKPINFPRLLVETEGVIIVIVVLHNLLHRIFPNL